MKIAIAADHAGFDLKDELLGYLRDDGHDVTDLGTDSADQPVDYPDLAQAAAEAVITGAVERAIVVCGSGVGASIAANKVAGAYAALCHDTYSARQGVEHDDMNILCLGSRVIGIMLARELVRAFLGARFEAHEPRHVRRHEKVRAIERAQRQ